MHLSSIPGSDCIDASMNTPNEPGAVRRAYEAIGRDRLSAASRDEERQMALCGWMWMIRQIGLVALFVAGLVDDGWGRADLLVLVATIITGVVFTLSRNRRQLVGPLTILDGALLAVLTALGLRPIAVFLVGVIILAWAAAFRPLYAAGAYVGVATSVIVLYAKGVRPQPWLAATAFCLLGAILVVRAVRLNMAARKVDERERLVADSIDALIWEGEPSAVVKISDNSERILGHPVDAWRRPGYCLSLVHPDDRAMMEEDLDQDDPRPVICRMRHADGTWRWMEHRMTSVRDHQGRHRFFAGVSIDRTEQIDAERDVMALGQMVQRSPVGQMLIGCGGDDVPTVLAANTTAADILGGNGTLVGRPLASVRPEHPSHRPRCRGRRRRAKPR